MSDPPGAETLFVVLSRDPRDFYELYKGIKGETAPPTPGTTRPDAVQVASAETVNNAVETMAKQFGTRDLGWIDDARRQAARFVHTISPSKFAQEQEIEPEATADAWIEIEPELRSPRIGNPATRYGIWWHGFAQKIPWHSQRDTWQAAFEANLSDSPEPPRAKREWKLLTKYASEDPSFFAANI